MNKKTTNSIFENFTNQYSLSKTLRFELKPVGKTEEMLKDNDVFSADKLRHDRYVEIKLYIDRLHREFTDEALQDINNDLCDMFRPLYEKYESQKQLPKRSDEYRQASDELYKIRLEAKKKIIEVFDNKARDWKKKYGLFKKDGLKILFEEAVLDLLKIRYPEAKKVFDPVKKEEVTVFDLYKGFFTSLGKYNQTRDNLYKIDIPTAHAVRLIDQNLLRYFDNYDIAIKRYREHKIDFEETCLSPKVYHRYLTQSGIDSYNSTIGEINALVNEFKQNNKGIKLPLLKRLDKQILSLVEIEENELTKDNFFSELNDFVADTDVRLRKAKELFVKLFNECNGFDLDRIYFSKKALNTILHKYFTASARFALEQKISKLSGGNKNKEGKYTLSSNFYSLQSLKGSLEDIGIAEEIFKDEAISASSSWEKFSRLFLQEIDSLFDEYINAGEKAKVVIDGNIFPNGTTEKEKAAKGDVQRYLDAVRTLYAVFGYVALEYKRQWKDELPQDDLFYGEFKDGFYDNNRTITFYNQTRNLLSQKEWSEEKWLLNFETGNLLNGWPDSPEGNTQYKSFIFRKHGIYYLGITDHARLFDRSRYPEAYHSNDNVYEKMVYKQLDGKTIYGSVYMGMFGSKYADDKKSKNVGEMQGRIKDILLTKVQDFPELKYIIDKINNKDYDGLNEIAVDISKLSLYKISFKRVSGEYVEMGLYRNKNKTHKLYLFQILNRDFTSKKNGSKNLHSLYFEGLFDDSLNLKLDGGAEIFFRPASIEAVVDKDRKTKHDVIVKKRYTEDKILFHLPITLNRVSKKIDSPRLFNESINQAFSKNIDDIAVIGIDRGEKHLLYYSLINSKGEIIEQKSLNEVNGIPYYRLLRDAERKRLEDRRSWNSARKIKDLKKGYVGHVVKELVDLVIKHNAVIVFEDLNMRFKQIRGGVDRSVYMQIEKALLNKLNYLSFKNRKPSEIGGIANGYQLAPLIKKESDKRKQAGIVLYTTAEYTSTTDPVTGFRKNIYLSSGTKQKDVSDIIGKFDAIGWDDKLQSYYFVYEPKNFESKTNKKKEDYVGKPWCVYADAPRVKREKNKESGIWEYELVNPNDMLRSLFSVWGFTQLEGDIKEQILEMEQEGLLSGKKQFDGKERTFIASLVYIFNLILALRNSFAKKLLINKKTGEVNEIGDDIDFIASPVAPFFSTYAKSDKYGELSPLNLAGLDQKIIGEKKAEIKEEFNGDANGAYNIARKGLLMLQKIHDDPQKPDLYISINEWDKFAQSQNKLD